MKTIGAFLQKWLDDHDRSPAWLSRKAGLSPAAVGKIIRGERKAPEFETMRRIARALKMTIVDLLGEIVPHEELGSFVAESKAAHGEVSNKMRQILEAAQNDPELQEAFDALRKASKPVKKLFTELAQEADEIEEVGVEKFRNLWELLKK